MTEEGLPEILTRNQTQIYNHGHKSWDTFAFLGSFLIHTRSTPPPSPQAKLDACIQNLFSEFHYCVGWEEGKLQENFEKCALFYKGTQRLQKIVITALLSQGL